VRNEADVAQVFPRDQVDDVGNLCVEIDVLAEKMRTVAVAGERGRIDLVAVPFEDVGDAAPAPATMIGAVHQHEGLARAGLRERRCRAERGRSQRRRAERHAARDRVNHRGVLPLRFVRAS